MKRTLFAALLPIVLVAGCSSSGTSDPETTQVAASVSTPTTVAETPAVETSSAAPTPTTEAAKDARAIAAAISDAVDSVTKTEDLTEDTDTNEMLGRPHGYTSATVIFDSNGSCLDGPGVDCGAVIEVFENDADAKARATYIDDVTSGLGPAYAEYDTQSGTALLRVSGQIKPSLAKEYKAAFLAAAGI